MRLRGIDEHGVIVVNWACGGNVEVYQLLLYVKFIPDITLIDLWPLFKVLRCYILGCLAAGLICG